MIIDTHVHFGSSLNFNLKKKTVLLAMEKYNVSKAIVSNCQSAEYDHNQVIIPDKKQVPMISSAKAAIDFAKDNPEKIYAAIWVKPHQELPSAELEYLIKVNLDYVKAIKFHPYHSAISFEDARIENYIQLAQTYDLPVITHTASDICSKCEHVYNMAKRFPKVRFVMAHLGLGTDNEEAIEMCAELPNLYGDTAWVPAEKAIKFIDKCSNHKLMFGSDMPIDGLDTYSENGCGQPSMYREYFNGLETKLSSEDYEKLMWKNATSFFKL